MTKEQVQALWDNEAAKVIKAQNVTGGTVDKGWNQRICGLINVQAFLAIYKDPGLKSEEKAAALIEAATIGSNSSQQGQRLFSEKKTKATALATDLAKTLKL